jgi:cation diffusion facilitator family transporter
MTKLALKSRIAMASVFSNAMLVVIKLVVGLLIGSVSVISEAVHSLVDLFASMIALVSVRRSGQPADRLHPYGHGKIENISGTVEAILIFLAALWIIYEAIYKIRNPEPVEAVGWGIAVMCLSAVVNMIVSGKLFKVGRETDSVALIADAWHLRTDIYTSAGVMIGLLVMTLCQNYYPDAEWQLVDPIAALIVAVMIIKAAYDLTMESVRDLLDVKLPDQEEKSIHAIIEQKHPQVIGYHHLRTRKSGPTRFIDFHIKVDARISIQEAHDISRSISDQICAKFHDVNVLIHMEPCEYECNSLCSAGCFIEPAARIEKVLAENLVLKRD